MKQEQAGFNRAKRGAVLPESHGQAGKSYANSTRVRVVMGTLITIMRPRRVGIPWHSLPLPRELTSRMWAHLRLRRCRPPVCLVGLAVIDSAGSRKHGGSGLRVMLSPHWRNTMRRAGNKALTRSSRSADPEAPSQRASAARVNGRRFGRPAIPSGGTDLRDCGAGGPATGCHRATAAVAVPAAHPDS